MLQHISPAPISRCTKSSGCISIMITRQVLSRLIQPQDNRNLRRYRSVSLCYISVQIVRMTFMKTSLIFQRHVKGSTHGGMLMLFNWWHSLIQGHFSKTHEQDSPFKFLTNWRHPLKGTFKGLASNVIPCKDLKRNTFPYNEFKGNLIILRSWHDPWN